MVGEISARHTAVPVTSWDRATPPAAERKTMAAAATAAERPDGLRDELRRFLKAATNETRLSQPELTHIALRLLKSLPAARDAGLEYLSSVLDGCTAQFVAKLEEGDVPESAAAAGEDELVGEISQALSGLLEANPHTWAPVISAWSLELLGRLSSRYSARAHVPHSAGLNDLVQLWLCCPATRALIHVTVLCVRHDTDVCIKPLLDTSAAYTPHFDWVVAHIGSCFPSTIIERVLSVGLREFCAQQAAAPGGTPGKRSSVVQILGHLAARNSAEICDALKALIQQSLGPSPSAAPAGPPDEVRLATVPFFLQLAGLSPLLLDTLSTEILRTVTVAQLAAVAAQVPGWIPRYFATAEALLSLTVHLSNFASVLEEAIRHASAESAAPEQVLRSVENRRLSRLVTVPQAHTTVFHPEDGARTLALLLVEFISPDVMFNGLPWPDEEFMKVTMERDLEMRRFFDHHPVSWCLLELVARRPPAICYCSVLLRALAATLIQHWSSTTETQACNSAGPLDVTERLLHVMALGQLLPPPLTLIPEMLATLTSHEVYLLLTDVWAYMRETVPSPAAFTHDAAGVASRSFPPLEARFTARLLLVLQNNMATLGHLFPQVRAAIAPAD
ncbi:integrator complex subunit 5-like [Pollicipes pollicipes]|uniref:integrator complex subunit 5-like n=1 Tax=Pollicipes pollicipes TaxID=41117 RepID=UPI00188504D9|nr:integrator complex subunit 5-like [Pollicipes pollicipes]